MTGGIPEPHAAAAGARSGSGRRRALVRLSACQALLTGSVLIGQTLGTLEAGRLAPAVSLAGAAVAMQLLGAVAALGLLRRPGPGALTRTVATGFAGVAAGALLCAAAVAWTSFSLLLVGNALLGAGAARALLLRASAAGLSERAGRGRAVGLVAVGGIGGSILAPVILRLPLAGGSETERLAPWGVVIFASLIGAALATSVPSAGASGHETPDGRPVDARRARRTVMAVCMAAGMTMVAVMSTATLQLSHLGTSDKDVALVLGAHYAAMFGAAVPFGVLADRYGRRAALLVSSSLIALAGVGMLADPHRHAAIALVLALVGAGWSGAFVTGTALLADLADGPARTALMARNDLLVAVASAGAALAATSLFARGGAPLVGVLVLALSGPAILAAWRLSGGRAGHRGRRGPVTDALLDGVGSERPPSTAMSASTAPPLMDP